MKFSLRKHNIKINMEAEEVATVGDTVKEIINSGICYSAKNITQTVCDMIPKIIEPNNLEKLLNIMTTDNEGTKLTIKNKQLDARIKKLELKMKELDKEGK